MIINSVEEQVSGPIEVLPSYFILGIGFQTGGCGTWRGCSLVGAGAGLPAGRSTMEWGGPVGEELMRGGLGLKGAGGASRHCVTLSGHTYELKYK